MEGIKVDQINYASHKTKCRLCFKYFGINEHRIQINSQIERKFRDVTQTDLKISKEYSNEICVICNFQLKDFFIFKRNVIILQKGLYKFSSIQKKSLKNDVNIEMENDTLLAHFKDIKNELTSSHQNSSTEFKITDGAIVEKNNLLKYNSESNIVFPIDVKTEEYFARKTSRENVNNETWDNDKTLSGEMQSIENFDEKSNLHSETLFKCENCEASFESYQSFQSHKHKMHSADIDVTKWLCRQCNTFFSGSRTLRDHVTIAHSPLKPQINCPVKNCSKTFLTIKRLKAHMKVHDNDAKEMCPECGLLVTNKHNLEKHIKRVHLKLRNFFCDLCGYSATFKHSIVSHMISHIDPNERRKWRCDLCSFISVSKQSLRAHKNYEHSGIIYTCHCGKGFNQRASLSTHIKCVHHKIKDHLCNICGKSYFTRKDLQNHKKSQHMERDMPCEICGKMFATQKHLTRHKMHHEEPRYKCPYEGCHKAFIDRPKLKDHTKLHENKRDNLCHLCEKSYFHQKDLKRHLDVAHKQTIFHCELCTFTISRKDYLRNHLNIAHKHLSLEEKNEVLARTKVTRNAV